MLNDRLTIEAPIVANPVARRRQRAEVIVAVGAVEVVRRI